MNKIQQLVARTFAGGEFDGLPPKDCGDSLFAFVMSEVEDAEDIDEAIRRMDTAIEDLEGVRSTLQTHKDMT